MNAVLLMKISHGEAVSIKVRGTTEKLDLLTGWVQQFQRLECGGNRLCLTFNRFTPFGGAEELDISIGEIPAGKRDLLAGTLQSKLIEAETPNEFTLK